MKKWMKKTIAIMVAFLTFGIITPDHEIWANFESLNQQKKLAIYDAPLNDIAETYQLDELFQEPQSPLQSLMEDAKTQSYIKFGSKITPVIQDEFNEIIFPKMAEAIETTLAEHENLLVDHIAITQSPSGDYKEKIFNLFDVKNGKDLMRFHVRIENRPMEGHYYNFHYHLYKDRFTTHYNLGEIYWSKNTPPKWLS